MLHHDINDNKKKTKKQGQALSGNIFKMEQAIKDKWCDRCESQGSKSVHLKNFKKTVPPQLGLLDFLCFEGDNTEIKKLEIHAVNTELRSFSIWKSTSQNKTYFVIHECIAVLL